MNAHVVYWVMMAFSVGAIPLLFLAWRWCLRAASGDVSTLRLILLIIATCSHAWLLLAMKFPQFLGASYSTVRFSIIDVNFLVMLACAITAFRLRVKGKILFGVACLLTTWLWGIVGAINIAV
jgi:hypothetical protein